LLKGKWKTEYDKMQMDDVSLQIIKGRLMLEDYFRVKVVLKGLIINYLHRYIYNSFQNHFQ
jgi:hypothetical protein